MREILRLLSSMLKDVRGVWRWCGLHSKRVGVRNHGSFPRRTKASTCRNEPLARHFFTTHGNHCWTCRIVAHCMSRTGHIRRTQNSSFVIQVEGDKRTQDYVFDCWKRCVLFCPSATPCASHRTLKKSSAAHHTAIVSMKRTDRLR